MTIALVAGVAVSSWQAVRARQAEREAKAVKDFLLEQLVATANPFNEPEPDPNKRPTLERIARQLEGRFADQPLIEAQLRFKLGQSFHDLGDYVQAASQFERCLAIRRHALTLRNSTTLETLAALADALTQAGRRDEAERLLTEGLAALQNSPLRSSLGAGMVLQAQAGLLFRNRQHADAVRYFQEALAVLQRCPEHTFDQEMSTIQGIVYATHLLGQTNEAHRMVAEAVQRCERERGETAAATASLLHTQAELLLDDRKWDEALAVLERYVPLNRRLFGTNSYVAVQDDYFLGRAFELKGDVDEAVRRYEPLPARFAPFFPADNPRFQCREIARFFVKHQHYDQARAAYSLLGESYELSLDELKAALLGSVDHSASLKNKVVTGGRLNLDRAMQYVTNPDPAATVIYASPAGWRARPDAPITVTFNRPMDRSSVESALVVEPAVAGTFEWLEGDRSFRFQHAEPFDTRTNYTVRLLATALDTAGGSLDGNFNQVRDGTPADDYLWTFRFPIANDDFISAQPLLGESGSTSGTLLFASQEPAEIRFAGSDQLGGTLWYRWSAPSTGGWYTFDLTGGTPSDTLLSVNAGDRLDQLEEVAGNDNYGTKSSSRTSFDARPGQSYSVVVVAKATSIEDLVNPAKAGKFTLTWYPTPAPGFTGSQLSPLSAIPGAKVALTGTNFTGATAVLFNGAAATFTNAAGNNLDLRITAVVPPAATSGPITVVTPHGSVTSTAMFQVLPPPLSIARLPAGDVEIRWAATSEAMVLEDLEDLAMGSWRPVGAVPQRAEGQSVVRLAPTRPTFYRLKTD